MLSKSISPHLDKVTTTPVPRHGGDVKKSFPVLSWHPLNAYWHTFCCVCKKVFENFLGKKNGFLVGQFVVASHPKSDELKKLSQKFGKKSFPESRWRGLSEVLSKFTPFNKAEGYFLLEENHQKKKTDLQKWWIIISLASFFILWFTSHQKKSLASKESLISTQPRKQSQKSPKRSEKKLIAKTKQRPLIAFHHNFNMC